ncbi:MAG: V-type ATPase 116kDa subunit family protein [candidate division WOR-3 bacterium]
MWVPEEMTHFLLGVVEEDLQAALDFIGKEGKFHLVEFSHRWLKETQYKEIYRKLEESSKRIKEIIEYFGIKSLKEIPLKAVDINKVREEAEKFLNEFEGKLGEKRSRLTTLKEEETELNLVSELLALLPEIDTPIEEIREGKFIKMIGGTIPSSEEKNLYEILKGRDVLVFKRKFQKGITPIIIFFSSFEEESLGKVLESVHFEELKVFSKLEGSILGLKDKIESKFWEIKEERATLQASIKRMGRNIEENILRLNREIDISLLELVWLSKTARSDKIFFISAYLPTKVVFEVKQKAKNLNIYILKEETIKRKNEEAKITPTKLNNPFLFRPFELLVNTYGIPSYRGIDPTIFTTISFLLFFGIMFGDFGHGLILISIGIALFFIRVMRKFAILPVLLGISSAIFGVIFGEFFGTHPFQPLWFSPFREPEKAMLFAVYLGVVIVSFGFILRLVEFIMEGNKEELFLSGYGLPGFIFYLSSLAFTFSLIRRISSKFIISEGAIIGMSALVVALGIPLKDAFKEGISSNKLLLSLGEFIHLLLAMISNTLSFIRVAAFNIGHIILTMSLLEISSIFEKMIGRGSATTLIFGNFLVVGLEGMIVFIQSLRLEYYEFYSRFFERGKEIYKPIKIK